MMYTHKRYTYHPYCENILFCSLKQKNKCNTYFDDIKYCEINVFYLSIFLKVTIYFFNLHIIKI